MVIQKHKRVIYGLEDDLKSLSDRITNLSSNTGNDTSAITDRLDIIEGDKITSGSILKAKQDVLDLLKSEEDARTAKDTEHTERLVNIESGLTKGVTFKASVDDISDLDNIIPDGKTEDDIKAGWAYYVKNENDVYTIVEGTDGDYKPSDWTKKSFIKTADFTEIGGLVADERTRAQGEEAKKLKIASNLDDLEDKEISRNNLDVYKKATIDDKIARGGALYITEELTVINNQITISNVAKNGVIFNFNCVRHIDSDGIAYDVPVTLTTVEGDKTYDLHPDTEGEFDNKKVLIQYSYIVPPGEATPEP